MCFGNPFNIPLQLLSGWRMNEREYPVPKRDYSRAPLFPLPRERWALLVLLAIMLLGAVLRFYGLGFQSLWGGELASWDFGGRDTISRVAQDGSQPPLYFLILHFARWIFGDSEWALRLPSAVAGWLCIPAIYLLGKKLYWEREGIMAALFLAVLWPPIYYSQEARPYAVLILLSILTAYFWWDLMTGLRYRGELPKREAAWYIVCAVLCAYTHYFGLLLVLLQSAALAALALDRLRKVALLYFPVVLAYLPWLPGMVNQFRNGEQAGYGQPALQALPDSFEFLFGRSILLALAAWTLLCFLLLRGWDDVRPRRKGAGVQPGLLLTAWAVGPFAFAYVVSQTSAAILTDETFLVSLPAVYLLMARAVTRAFSGRAAKVFQGTVAAGLAAASLAYLLFSMDYYTTQTKEQVREAAGYVVAHEDKGTLVVRCDAGKRLDYYLNAEKSGGRNSMQACEAKDVQKVESKVKQEGYTEVFHLISHPWPDQEMISLLQRNFQPVDYERFDGAAVVTYKVGQRPSSGPPQPKPASSSPNKIDPESG
jgi:mannosyltransferase